MKRLTEKNKNFSLISRLLDLWKALKYPSGIPAKSFDVAEISACWYRPFGLDIASYALSGYDEPNDHIKYLEEKQAAL